ncbi:MAG: Pr6Pr family membrane protein [Sphingomicrobium sp.]
MPRAAAALTALICWAALGIRFAVTNAGTHDPLATLWILARFFTITTNLAVAVAMTIVAFGKPLSDFVLGGLTLAILLVGIVYALLLAKLYHLTGGALVADTLMHKVSPVAMTLYWFVFAPHSRLRWSAPWWWALYPIGYFAYALGRGASDGLYPYPFMDVGKIGLQSSLINAALIAAAFVVVGEVLVWLDRQVLGRAALMSKAPS